MRHIIVDVGEGFFFVSVMKQQENDVNDDNETEKQEDNML